MCTYHKYNIWIYIYLPDIDIHTSTIILIDEVITRPLNLTGGTGTLVYVCELHLKHTIIQWHNSMSIYHHRVYMFWNVRKIKLNETDISNSKLLYLANFVVNLIYSVSITGWCKRGQLFAHSLVAKLLLKTQDRYSFSHISQKSMYGMGLNGPLKWILYFLWQIYMWCFYQCSFCSSAKYSEIWHCKNSLFPCFFIFSIKQLLFE